MSSFRGTVDKINALLKFYKRTRTLSADVYSFMMISRSFPLVMGNVSDRSCRENQNTHFVFHNIFFPENLAIYEMWKSMIEPDRPLLTI
jgi:hypothetical protein